MLKPYTNQAPIPHRGLECLKRDERALFEHILEGFRNRQIGSLNFSEETVAEKIRTVQDFIAFAGKAPWQCTADDFDRWCAWKVEDSIRTRKRKLATSSQRKYQGAIKSFYEYMCFNPRFVRDIETRYDTRPVQVVTDENRIPHRVEHERSVIRRPFTRDEITLLFKTIRRMILDARRSRSKSFYPLQRDKLMFALMYYCGLRISEACSLDVNSIKPGERIFVMGKGAKGSGRRQRSVTTPARKTVDEMILWYLNYVRPHLLKPDNPNEIAMFLTEQGKRVTPEGTRRNFHKIIQEAGLDGNNFTPHSLRHSFATHLSEASGSIHVTQEALGHQHASTTQGYIHFDEPYISRKIGEVQKKIENAYRKRGKRGKK